MRIASGVLAVSLCFGCTLGTPAVATTVADQDTTWMAVLLGGRKIGHLQTTRERGGNVVTTTQTLSIALDRNGQVTPLDYVTRSIETIDGKPLGFASRSMWSAVASTTNGTRQADGNFEVSTEVGGQTRTETMAWPGAAVLAEGQRLAMLAASRHPGSHYTLAIFDPGSRTVASAQVEVLGDEPVTINGQVETLSHQREKLFQARGDQTFDLWLDAAGRARKGLIGLIGKRLEMVACDRACALAPNQRIDMFAAATVGAPRRLTALMRNGPLRYRVHVAGPIAQPFLDTDEQTAVAVGGGDWLIDVGGYRAGGQPPPQPADLLPTAWMQSDAPLIRELTAQAIGDAPDAERKMRRLHRFVAGYLTEHALDVGYASALEVARDRRGDCTEYALLLAAMARAAGIPSRVVTGMAYAGRIGSTADAFVPHAWMEAWMGNRWRSYDAALRRFDSGHIAIDRGDGDPWHFYGATHVFGQLRIDQVRAGDDLMDSAVDGLPSHVTAPPGTGADAR